MIKKIRLLKKKSLVASSYTIDIDTHPQIFSLSTSGAYRLEFKITSLKEMKYPHEQGCELLIYSLSEQNWHLTCTCI